MALYGILVVLFCYCIFFATLKPQDTSPLLWVVMGAAAICVNAGTTLLTEDARLPFLAAQPPLINGVTLMIRAWWAVVATGMARHIVRWAGQRRDGWG